jgi:hypothetical protein
MKKVHDSADGRRVVIVVFEDLDLICYCCLLLLLPK